MQDEYKGVVVCVANHQERDLHTAGLSWISSHASSNPLSGSPYFWNTVLGSEQTLCGISHVVQTHPDFDKQSRRKEKPRVWDGPDKNDLDRWVTMQV